MKYQLSCGDVMPGCATTFESGTHDGLLTQVAAHAAVAHGITTITPDVREAVEAQVRRVD